MHVADITALEPSHRKSSVILSRPLIFAPTKGKMYFTAEDKMPFIFCPPGDTIGKQFAQQLSGFLIVNTVYYCVLLPSLA